MGQGQTHHALSYSQEMMRCTRYTLEGVVNSNGVAEEEKYQAQKAIENLIMGWNTIENVTHSQQSQQSTIVSTMHNGHPQISNPLYSPQFGPHQYAAPPQNYFIGALPSSNIPYQQFGPGPF